MSYWTIWLIIVILLAVIEACTVNLVSIWFVGSGIISLFVSLFNDSFFLQFGIFVGCGILFLILTKPALDKMIKEKNEKTNLERIIGMNGVVTQEIKKNEVGEVKVDGKLWSAIASKKITEGTLVVVKSIESVKLVVEKVEEEKEQEPKEKKPAPKKKTTTSTKKKTSSKKSTTKTTTTKKKTTTKKGEE